MISAPIPIPKFNPGFGSRYRISVGHYNEQYQSLTVIFVFWSHDIVTFFSKIKRFCSGSCNWNCLWKIIYVKIYPISIKSALKFVSKIALYFGCYSRAIIAHCGQQQIQPLIFCNSMQTRRSPKLQSCKSHLIIWWSYAGRMVHFFPWLIMISSKFKIYAGLNLKYIQFGFQNWWCTGYFGTRGHSTTTLKRRGG